MPQQNSQQCTVSALVDDNGKNHCNNMSLCVCAESLKICIDYNPSDPASLGRKWISERRGDRRSKSNTQRLSCSATKGRNLRRCRSKTVAEFKNNTIVSQKKRTGQRRLQTSGCEVTASPALVPILRGGHVDGQEASDACIAQCQ